MYKIFLCCAAGMSTSILVSKMKQYAESKNIPLDIKAVSMDQFEKTIVDYDYCLMGPQIKYKYDEFKTIADSHGKPISVISNIDYGMMRGDKILEETIKILSNQ